MYPDIQTSITTNWDSTPQEKLGTVRKSHTDDRKLYKYVKYSVGTISPAAAAGDAVGYVATTGYGASVVTSDVSATDSVLAGVTLSAATDGYYGWIQIAGPNAAMSVTFVSGSAGNLMTLSSSTDATLKVAGADTDAGGAVMVAALSVILKCPT